MFIKQLLMRPAEASRGLLALLVALVMSFSMGNAVMAQDPGGTDSGTLNSGVVYHGDEDDDDHDDDDDDDDDDDGDEPEPE